LRSVSERVRGRSPRDWGSASRVVAEAYFPHELRLVGGVHEPRLTLRTLDLGPVMIGQVGWGADVAIDCDYPGAYEVNLPITGHLESRGRHGPITSVAGQGTVFRADAPSLISHWDATCTVLGVKFDSAWFDVEAERLLGTDRVGVRELLPDQLRLDEGRGRAWRQLVTSLATNLHDPHLFADSDLVRQQYLDFYGRVGDPGGVTYWTTKLTSGSKSIVAVIDSFLHSAEFGRSVAPVARLALVCLGGTPAFDDLLAWAAAVKAGGSLATTATAVCAKPEFTSRFASLTHAAFVPKAFQAALGKNPTAAEQADLVAKLASGALTRPALMAALVGRPESVTRYRAQVEVLMTYAGLLRRRPDASGWTYWVGKVGGGTSVQRLIAQFFASAEYRRRFAG